MVKMKNFCSHVFYVQTHLTVVTSNNPPYLYVCILNHITKLPSRFRLVSANKVHRRCFRNHNIIVVITIKYRYENMTLKITLKNKIERTKHMSNAEFFQWDYKGLTILDNISRQILMWWKRQIQCDIFCKAFECGFSGFSVWSSVSYSHTKCIEYGLMGEILGAITVCNHWN